MEIFLKRYSWTLNVAVVVLAGVVAGRTVSALSAVHLAEPVSVESPEAERPRTVHAVASTVNARSLADVFGVGLPSDKPEPEPEEPEEIDLGEEVPTSLNATLVATVEARPERFSVALITDNTSRSTAVYGIGDMLMGSAEILRVERRRVLVRNAGRTEYLEMDGEEGDSSPTVASATRRGPVTSPRRTEATRASSSPSGPDLSDSIERTGENEYTVAQDAIESTLANLNTIATQARIVPAFKNGVAEGFKLFSIRPGSIYAQIGIQNGDVVRKINGFEINSPDRALEVYQRLRESSRVEVELERRGQTVRKVYNIQ